MNKLLVGISLVAVFALGIVLGAYGIAPRLQNNPPPTNMQTALSVSPQPTLQKEKPITTDWSKRILYRDPEEFKDGKEVKKPFVIHSLDLNGSDRTDHSPMCDSKPVMQYKLLTRSPDGRYIAFIKPLPGNETNVEKDMSSFTQGEIVIYDLETDICRSLELTADAMYGQSMAFSPDGKYLAYVFYGLHLYNISTGEDTVMTTDEGSARFGTIITGPLVWNSQGSSVYTAIGDGLDYPNGMSTKLYRININEIEEVRFPWADGTSTKLAKREIITELADLYMDAEGKRYIEGEIVPENPLVYAISPDESKVLFEQKGNLVMKNLTLPQSETVYWQRESQFQDYTQRVDKISWLPNGAIIFSTSQMAPGSSAGNVWMSRNADTPEKIHGYGYSILNPEQIAYNFEYFGDYYIPYATTPPVGFESSGHRYDGIGVYNLVTREDAELSGKNKPVGYVL